MSPDDAFDDLLIGIAPPPDAPSLETPARRLVLALIQTAVRDAMSTNKRAADTAREWLASDADPETYGTFAWCCDQLDVEPGKLRASLAGRTR